MQRSIGGSLFPVWVAFQVILSELLFLNKCEASIIINEVAYKGSPAHCEGEDWIELVNTDESSSEVNLLNFTLHDDKGKNDEDAKIFPSLTMASGEFKVLCGKIDFDFKIGASDSVTLLENRDSGVVLSTVTLPGTGGDTETYAYFDDLQEDAGYKYTTSPTPGTVNVYSEPKSFVQRNQDQNDAGKDFFLDDMKPGGTSDVFSTVVDINVVMDAESLAFINDNPVYEENVRFTEVSVSNSNNSTIIRNGGGGKIRTKGQSTLSITACVGLKNVPFQIEFDSPFFGMEVAYFRNHMADESYLREYGAQVMLLQFGLPYLRSRPVRLSLNGEYIGFYTMMEAPTQGYVMQRSFGTFDPSLTALFKIKTSAGDCPYSKAEIEVAEKAGVPDPYYFERGDHRDNVPTGITDVRQCIPWFYGQIMKDRADVIRGYVAYNQTCGHALVNLGRVDRDYGPKSTEDAMISFLDSKVFDPLVTDWKGSVDADQWLKNFAAYAVMMNQDSPVSLINNWYLATTNGGMNDWKIFQWDHNNVASAVGASICGDSCESRMIYWPILRPTCEGVEDHPIVGRVMNDDTTRQKYLEYVEEFLGVVNTTLLNTLRAHGHKIKEFVAEDPLFGALSANYDIEFYENSELSPGFDDYNTPQMPFLKVMGARLEQVRAQLDAIKEGTLPRDGVYDTNEICPDWRDSNGEDYLSSSTLVDGESCNNFEMCSAYAACYAHSIFGCSPMGEMVSEACLASSPYCDGCFPYSRCGTYESKSTLLVENKYCGSDVVAACKSESPCFDHRGGICAFDGEILRDDCTNSELNCKNCFLESRCGSTEASTKAPSKTASTKAPSEAVLTKAPSKTASTNAPSETPPKTTTEAPTPSTSSSGEMKKIVCATIFAVTFFLFSFITSW